LKALNLFLIFTLCRITYARTAGSHRMNKCKNLFGATNVRIVLNPLLGSINTFMRSLTCFVVQVNGLWCTRPRNFSLPPRNVVSCTYQILMLSLKPTHGAQSYWRSHSRNSLQSIEPESLLQCSHKLATGLYAEPDESSQNPLSYF
jgi:hypothetical protein